MIDPLELAQRVSKSEIELLRELLEEIFSACERNIRELELLSGQEAAEASRTRLKLWREKKEFAAHYEPVPEPPARRLGCVHSVPTQGCDGCDVWRKELGIPAPSVSEEQPAQIVCNCDVEMFGKHCDWCPLFREICDECAMSLPKHATGCPAKAKLESLRGENNGDTLT